VNRKGFGFGEGLHDQEPVDFWSCFGTRESNEGEACLGGCVAV